MSTSLLHRITINPEIAHGKPTIRNKRYTVKGILEYLAGGDSFEDLLEEFLISKQRIYSLAFSLQLRI